MDSRKTIFFLFFLLLNSLVSGYFWSSNHHDHDDIIKWKNKCPSRPEEEVDVCLHEWIDSEGRLWSGSILQEWKIAFNKVLIQMKQMA